MAAPQQSPPANNLLQLVPPMEYGELAKDLKYVSLPMGTALAHAHAGEPIYAVYFLTSGIGSVVITTPLGRMAEVGIFGFDGYIPTSAVTGARISSYDVGVRLDGEGYVVGYDDFRRWMKMSERFALIMNHSMECFAVQLAHTAVSNAVHDVTERLARWLLMCHDRVRDGELTVTHEFLSIMLGVRRPSVTTSLHVLEGEGLIRAQRAHVTIRDRPGLEAFAQDAYGAPEADTAG